MMPFAEWMPDRPDLSQASSVAKNCVWTAGRYQQLLDKSASTSTAFSGDCLGAYSFVNVGSNAKVYAGTYNALFELSSGGWTDASGSVYNLSTNNRWEFAQFAGDVYATTLAEPIQKQPSGTGTFGDVSGAPNAACIWPLKNFLMVGDLEQSSVAYPYRVQWSAIGDGDDWPSPGSADAETVQSGEQDLDAQWGKVTAIRGADYAIIFQEKAITRATYAGAPIVWQFDTIDNERGCVAPGSAVQVGRLVYFWASDGIYVTDGSGESQPIGHGKVDQWLQDNMNTDYYGYVSGSHDPVRKLVFWSFRSTSGSENDRLLIYNYAENRFTYAEMSVERLFSATTAGTSLEDLDDITTDLDALPASLDDPRWLGGGAYFGAIYQGDLYEFTGSALDAVLETGEASLNPGQKAFVRAVKPICDGTLSVQVGTRKTQAASVTWSSAASVQADTGFAYFRENAFYHRVRTTITGGFTDAQGMELVARKSGGR